MERKLRIGILGGGGILSAHAPGLLKMHDRCEVMAVAEPNEKRHGRIRELLQANVPIYADYSEVLALPELDAVDILLPHDLHKDAAVKAASKGMHVLVEKVMARNVYECREMTDACDKAGVQLVVAHDRRYAGDWVAMKNIVDSGMLGDILFIKMEHNQDVYAPEGSWIRTVDGIGGGSIMSCLCHQIDALRWYFGEVEKVSCMHKILPERMEGECIGTINLTMESGALALLSINWHTQSFKFGSPVKNGLWYEFNHVTGSLGEAYYMRDKGTFVKKNIRHSADADVGEFAGGDVDTNTGFDKVEVDQTERGHVYLIEEFIKAARGEKANVLTFGRDSLKTVEVAEAAYIAAATDTIVKLPVTPIPWDQRLYMK
jgi:predicted dehydrogenase